MKASTVIANKYTNENWKSAATILVMKTAVKHQFVGAGTFFCPETVDSPPVNLKL